MPKLCMICTSQLRPKIDTFLNAGASSYWVSSFCKENNFKVSATTIGRHKNLCLKLDSDYQNKMAKDALAEMEITPIRTQIDLKQYLKDRGMPDNLHSLNAEDIKLNYTKLIQGLNELTFKTLCLLNYKIDNCLNEEEKYPMDLIRGLKYLLECQNFYISEAISKGIDFNVKDKTNKLSLDLVNEVRMNIYGLAPFSNDDWEGK